MTTDAHVHVISKADIGKHKAVSISTTLPSIGSRQIQARAAIISLTNNNLSYAQLGSIMKWWDAYPVPSDLPSPYNDREAYGIVPAWGYAEVLDSQVPGIETGSLLYGFWPTSDLPVDLELDAADVEGQFIEVSEARKGLMNAYQRYFLRDPDMRLANLDQAAIERLAWESAVRPVWEAGYLINHAIFGKAHVHPSGAGTWTGQDADLSSAVVISLAASGKTARAFAQAVVNRRAAADGPLGFMAITSVSKGSLVPQARFPTKTVEYGSIADEGTMQWVRGVHPEKIVVVDFGGRGDALLRLHGALTHHLLDVEIVVVGVGGNPEVRTAKDLTQWSQQYMLNPNFERVRMNTSGIRDTLMSLEGPARYWDGYHAAWVEFRQSSYASDLKLELGEGIAGAAGFEGGWSRITTGEVLSDVAVAFRVS